MIKAILSLLHKPLFPKSSPFPSKVRGDYSHMPVMSLQNPKVTRGNTTASGPAGSRLVVIYCIFLLWKLNRSWALVLHNELMRNARPVWPCYVAPGEVSLSLALLWPLKESCFPNEHLKHFHEHFLTLSRLRQTINFSKQRSRSGLLKTILSYGQIWHGIPLVWGPAWEKKGASLRDDISPGDEEMPQRLSIYPGICKRFFLLFIFVIYIPAMLRGLE